ncbi:putative F-box domain-containing protein [Helianthus annuus]|uniref:F-box domain-containing protein n=1 Tax=Helianthus annuus TaxID=4232 RepID=A0A9K3IHK1_HELAN|nr:putative F-box domain-containing protein [Helianthus annuus]KAJ0540383.1 putative F-box domain-containing protein [Helianthus annuus]KAJ0548899.1 putative F-box domain-containing protein [Helianthus annuus]KAJ0555124.1 putative F-box domain-containing protein [Helianthus annuus]KAJ0720691.1 putative F-box domain-containing protein [Helianthus annuus]
MKKKKMKNDELPLSLIESNILPRLPAKSVGRCMCVCKQWKSFLSTPMFARMHLRHVTINDYNDVVGFYTDSSNDYKLLYLINGARNGAYIYSNRLDSWRKIDFSVGTACSERPQSTLCGKFVYFKASHRWIICFDVKTEKFRKIQCPPVPGGAKSYRRSLVVLHGCIHLCVSYKIIINDI